MHDSTPQNSLSRSIEPPPDEAHSIEAHSIEDWCVRFIAAESLKQKSSQGRRPDRFDPSWPADDDRLRTLLPGRSPELKLSDRAERIPKAGALREASARVKLLHVFLHHELQAAELSAWAVLRFRATPESFRRGLLGVLDDELRHAQLYQARIEALGASYGTHAVRDWFWERARACESPLQYTALMGLGFEGANLEHAKRFERQLRDAGDEESAELLGRIGREEVAHVHFAARWFTEWSGGDPEDGPDFDAWAEALPPPLTPAVLRGAELARERRVRAGLSHAFIDRLDACSGVSERSPRA